MMIKRWAFKLDDSETSPLAIRDGFCRCRADAIEAPRSGEFVKYSDHETVVEHLTVQAEKRGLRRAAEWVAKLDYESEKLPSDLEWGELTGIEREPWIKRAVTEILEGT